MFNMVSKQVTNVAPEAQAQYGRTLGRKKLSEHLHL